MFVTVRKIEKCFRPTDRVAAHSGVLAEAAAALTTTPNPPDPDGFELVCSVAELQEKGKLLRRLSSGRGVALWHHRGQFLCLDHACYHHGGPLIDGDIEDLREGVSCVLCPWHKYKVSFNGECLYVGIDITTRETTLKSKGLKQRPHEVRAMAGSLYVRDSASRAAASAAAERELPAAAALADVLPSDAYAKLPFNSGATGPQLAVPIHSSISASPTLPPPLP